MVIYKICVVFLLFCKFLILLVCIFNDLSILQIALIISTTQLRKVLLRIIIPIDDTDTAVIAGRHAFQIAATFGRALETVAAVDSKLKFCIQCGIPDLDPINVFQNRTLIGNVFMQGIARYACCTKV